MEAADLDGDGRDELIVTGSTSTELISVLSRSGSEFRLSRVMPLSPPESILGRIAIWNDETSHQVHLFAVIENSFGDANLVTFSGLNLNRESVVPVPASFHLQGVADVDADGELEAFGVVTDRFAFDPSPPFVLDVSSGNVEWEGTGYEGGYVAAGQFDSDPALELILSKHVSGSGYIFDGANHTIDWTWSSGPGGIPVVGDMLGDHTTQEFALVDPYGIAHVARVSPSFAFVSSSNVGDTHSARAYDVSGDGWDDLVIGNRGLAGIHVYSARDWSEVFARENPAGGVLDLAFGHFVEDECVELAWGSGTSDNEPDRLQIESLQTNARLYEGSTVKGPYSSVVTGDFNGDGTTQVAYATVASERYHGGPELVVLDRQGGREIRKSSSILDVYWAYGPWPILAMNIDSDPQDEIVLGGGGQASITNRLVAVDGKTLELEWAVPDDVSHLRFQARAIAMVNANEDPWPDIAMATEGKVFFYSGADGAKIWESITFSGASLTDVHTLLAGQFDDDAAQEVAFSVDSKLYILDMELRLVEQAIPVGFEIIHQELEETPAGCVHVIYGRSSLVRRECSGATLSTRDYSPEIEFVRSLDGSMGTLLLGDGTSLWTDYQGQPRSITSGELGLNLGRMNRGTIEINGTRATAFMGSDVGVYRLEFGIHTIFDGGFED